MHNLQCRLSERITTRMDNTGT
uniref:Uncharacterized protein n=1 Tax=Anguilla anguilla TaxID=7936 RepID=A0A0E9UHI4_ANGAN